MPGFDRTGPLGAGPMTGGGRGLCNPSTRGSVPAFRNGLGYGRGLRMRQGFRGRGWSDDTPRRRFYGRFRQYPPYETSFYPMSIAEETRQLKAEADYLKNSLDAINRRLDELEKEPSKES